MATQIDDLMERIGLLKADDPDYYQAGKDALALKAKGKTLPGHTRVEGANNSHSISESSHGIRHFTSQELSRAGSHNADQWKSGKAVKQEDKHQLTTHQNAMTGYTVEEHHGIPGHPKASVHVLRDHRNDYIGQYESTQGGRDRLHSMMALGDWHEQGIFKVNDGGSMSKADLIVERLGLNKGLLGPGGLAGRGADFHSGASSIAHVPGVSPGWQSGAGNPTRSPGLPGATHSLLTNPNHGVVIHMQHLPSTGMNHLNVHNAAGSIIHAVHAPAGPDGMGGVAVATQHADRYAGSSGPHIPKVEFHPIKAADGGKMSKIEKLVSRMEFEKDAMSGSLADVGGTGAIPGYLHGVGSSWKLRPSFGVSHTLLHNQVSGYKVHLQHYPSTGEHQVDVHDPSDKIVHSIRSTGSEDDALRAAGAGTAHADHLAGIHGSYGASADFNAIKASDGVPTDEAAMKTTGTPVRTFGFSNRKVGGFFPAGIVVDD